MTAKKGVTSTPSERRFDAIREISLRFLDATQEYEVRAGTTRVEVAAAIEDLRPLGRSDRWDAALDKWRAWVLDEEVSLRWSIVEGSTWAGHAAR
jgi:hypothetical protein